jgi:hypothetical protein
LFTAGVDHGIVQAGFPTRPGAPVQVCSIQTLHARAVRTRTIDLPPADLLFVDECHHARARTYERLIAAYPNAILIGITATPCRGDGRGWGNIFEVLVEAPSVAELTRLGYLVPAKIYAPVRLDLTGVRVQHGDYVEADLAKRLDTAQLVGDIVEHWHRLGEGPGRIDVSDHDHCWRVRAGLSAGPPPRAQRRQRRFWLEPEAPVVGAQRAKSFSQSTSPKYARVVHRATPVARAEDFCAFRGLSAGLAGSKTPGGRR